MKNLDVEEEKKEFHTDEDGGGHQPATLVVVFHNVPNEKNGSDQEQNGTNHGIEAFLKVMWL